MARLIFDTSVLIEAGRPALDPEGFLDPGDEVAIAAVTAAELLEGAFVMTPGVVVCRA